MTDVKSLYKEHYEIYHEHIDKDASKGEWAADRIFGLTTYDGDLDELFVKNILEVCKVILNGENFEYIDNHDNYVKYILICQMLDRFHWIEWGTSIRSAWFEDLSDSRTKRKNILDEYEWWQFDDLREEDVSVVVDTVPFTHNNLKTLIEFMEEEDMIE